jgi:hypothetical protein
MREVPIWCIAPRMAAMVLALAAPLPVVAAKVVLPLTDLQPQYASQLCWAAADTIAVNSFYAYTNPSSCLTGTTPGHTSQSVEAAFRKAGATSLASVGMLLPAVASALSACESNIQVCNESGTPILPGLTFHSTANGDSLTWTVAKQQIDGGHPFLFQWNYPPGGGSSRPSGLHELVAIGYSDDSGQQLIIWDPWPVPKTLPSAVAACAPDPAISSQQQTAHTHTIDFTVYADPESDMGVDAAHVGDQYDIALPVSAPVPDAPVLTVDGAQAPSPPAPKKKLVRVRQDSGVSIDMARKYALPSSMRTAMLNEPSQNANSSPAQTIGVPFPIIGLGLEDLRGTELNPLELLTRTTSAVLFPLESNGEVVGSFLMLLRDGKWHRGGYSNTEITKLLVQARSNYAKKENLSPETFYLLSVPGRAAFFAAHGRDKQAVLIPASSDPSIKAVAEVPVLAVKMLGQLSAAIKRDDALAAKSQAAAGYRVP